MTVRFLAALALAASASAHAAAPPLVLDGAFADWDAVPALAVDPVDAPGRELDLRAIHAASDGAFVHLLVQLGRVVNPQRLDGRLLVLVDADADPATGAARHGLDGVDFALVFSPSNPRRPDAPGEGVAAELGADGARVGPYEVGAAFAPTYASDVIELRFDRATIVPGAPGAFARRIVVRLVAIERDGTVGDATDALPVDLVPRDAAPPAGAGLETLRRAPDTDLRVVSWNVEYGGIFKEEDRAVRVLEALAPDVLLLQELEDRNGAADLERLLRRTGGDWHVTVGRGGGNLRCAIAARLPFEEAAAASFVAQPADPARQVRSAAIVAPTPGGTLVLASTHLKCCGRVGADEDVKRETEARAVNAALRADARRTGGAVVVAGDLNLVGGAAPLHLLRAGLDDGRDLVVAEPHRLAGRTNATWRDARSPFAPGRLDYLAYAGSELVLRRAFVLDTADLDAEALAALKLEADDLETVSDHLPVVADFAWRRDAQETAP